MMVSMGTSFRTGRRGQLTGVEVFLIGTALHVGLDVADGPVGVGERLDIDTGDEYDDRDEDADNPAEEFVGDGDVLHTDDSCSHGDAKQQPVGSAPHLIGAHGFLVFSVFHQQTVLVHLPCVLKLLVCMLHCFLGLVFKHDQVTGHHVADGDSRQGQVQAAFIDAHPSSVEGLLRILQQVVLIALPEP